MNQLPSLPVRNSLTPPRSPHPLSDTTCTTDDDETIVAMLAPVAAKNSNSKNDVAKTVVDDDAGINENENENENDDSSIEDDLDFINQMYGSSSSDEEEEEEELELKGDDTFAAPTPASTTGSPTAIPPPSRSSPPPTTTRRKSQNSTSLSGQKYDYNPTRIPRRSSLKQPPGNNNSNNNNDTSSSSSSRGRSSIAVSPTRNVVRYNSADSVDKRRGSISAGGRGGTVHSVRMRGSVYPVQRRRSIEFEECVKIQEVRRMTELNVQDDTTSVTHRDLWIQPDEVAEMKDRRRTLLKKYKEREELKKEQQKQIELQEKEDKKIQQQEQKLIKKQKMKQKLLNININGKHIFKNNNKLQSSSTTGGGRKEQRRSMSPKKNVPNNGGTKKASRRLSLTNFKISSPKRKELYKQLLLSSKSSSKSPPPPPPPPPPMPSTTNTQNLDSNSYHLPIARESSSSSTSSFVSINNGSFSGSFGADSFRGLEKYVDRSGRHQKHMAWDTVLIEQDEQEQFGYYDDERIAKLYQDCQNEHNGQQKVLDRAEKDRQFANDYLLTPRTMKLVKKSIPTTMQMQMMTANIDLNNSCHSINIKEQLKEEEEEEEESSGGDGDDATTNEIQHENEKSAVEQHSPAPAGDSGYRRYARRLSC